MRHTSFQINNNMVKRIERLLTGTQTISRFASIATEEKVNRMEARDKRARKELFEKDVETLTPIVKAILERLSK